MKTYCVVYNITTSYDSTVKAKNEKEARAKVIEVIGQPLQIEQVWEVTEKTNA